MIAGATRAWAQAMLARPDLAILDSETTGLRGDDQLIELALLDGAGATLFSARFRPTVPIHPDAAAVHGLTSADLDPLPLFPAHYDALCEILATRYLLVYNADFDRRLLRQTCAAFGLPVPACRGWECLMQQYAAYWGDWDARRGCYKLQKLPGSDHSALGDCRAALTRLQEMAGTPGARV